MMSRLVELSPREYSPAAFAAFRPDGGFTIDNARAMMWLSQLAYETGKPDTIQAVAPAWGFATAVPFVKRNVTIKATYDTCGIVGERQDAVVIAFAGTDPAVWETWATDFNARPSLNSDTHFGFQAAADAVRDQVRDAIALSQRGQKPLFMTGHSLGGAVAALAAEFALSQGGNPAAVYVFGMPRAGREQYRVRYKASLGDRTFQFVHGLDVVSRVPNTGLGFRHVGHVFECASGGKFVRPTPLADLDSDAPPFAQEIVDVAVAGVGNILTGNVLSPPGPGQFGPLFRFLPQPIRDHLQDRYWTALTP
jgi:triacylglycerol lipase